MQTVQVRQSPSGPTLGIQIPTNTNDIANSSGVPGASDTDALNYLVEHLGPVQREVLKTIPLLTEQVLTDALPQPVQDGVTPFEAELFNPEPTLMYSGSAEFDVVYYGGAIPSDHSFGFYIEGSIDEGVSWFNFASSSLPVYALPADASTGRHVSLTMPPVLGSVLGIVDATVSLRLRIAANRDTPGLTDIIKIISPQGSNPNGSGTLKLQLTERRVIL